jgi:DNA-binding Lrp family transcriptional regulator
MIEAYVLVETRLGRAREVEHRFEELDEVLHADVVTGCYDVLARVRVEDPGELAGVEARMEAVEGVTRALVCPVSHQVETAHRGWTPLHAAV